jgi:hypothetical protein
MRLIFIVGMFIFTLMIAQYFYQVRAENQTGVWQFAIPGYISVRLFGAVCGAVVALTLTQLLVDSEIGRAKSLHYAALTFILTITIWTGTRAAVMGVAGVIMINWFFFKVRPSPRVLLRIALCVGLARAPDCICKSPPFTRTRDAELPVADVAC